MSYRVQLRQALPKEVGRRLRTPKQLLQRCPGPRRRPPPNHRPPHQRQVRRGSLLKLGGVLQTPVSFCESCSLLCVAVMSATAPTAMGAGCRALWPPRRLAMYHHSWRSCSCHSSSTYHSVFHRVIVQWLSLAWLASRPPSDLSSSH